MASILKWKHIKLCINTVSLFLLCFKGSASFTLVIYLLSRGLGSESHLIKRQVDLKAEERTVFVSLTPRFHQKCVHCITAPIRSVNPRRLHFILKNNWMSCCCFGVWLPVCSMFGVVRRICSGGRCACLWRVEILYRLLWLNIFIFMWLIIRFEELTSAMNGSLLTSIIKLSQTPPHSLSDRFLHFSPDIQAEWKQFLGSLNSFLLWLLVTYFSQLKWPLCYNTEWKRYHRTGIGSNVNAGQHCSL